MGNWGSSSSVILREPGPRTVFSTRELRQLGYTDYGMDRKFTRVLRGVYVQEKVTRMDIERLLFQRRYWLPATERARAFHLTNPRGIATGFAALALARMKYFVDEQPTVFKARTTPRSRNFGPLCHPGPPGNRLVVQQSREPIPEELLWSPDRLNPTLRALTPLAACAEILGALERGDERLVDTQWQIPASLKKWETRVRQIQVLDATLRLLPQSQQRGTGRLLEELLELADAGSESPAETAMRLLLKKSLEGSGYAYLTQVLITVEERRVTVVDALVVHRTRLSSVREVAAPMGWSEAYPCRLLALAEGGDGVLGAVALMFDGRHHEERPQRERDSEISAVLLTAGLTTLRVTMKMLASETGLLRQVLHLAAV